MFNTETAESRASHQQASILNQAPSERRADFVQAVMNRAFALFRSGQLDSADVLFETMASEPMVRPLVQHIRGVIAINRGEDALALELIEEAIRLNPTDAEAHANLGLVLFKDRQHPQALAAYAAAVTLRPDNVAAQLGLARALTALGFTDFALDAFRDVLALAPDYVEAVIDFAALINDMGRHDEAISMLRDRLMRHPERHELHMVLSICLFAVGDWSEAWAEYEWRLKAPQLTEKLLRTDRPRWQGEDLAGKTILLQSEQGFGDTLHFARYAAMVAARGGRVMLRAPQALLPLLRTVAGIDTAFDPEAKAPAFDVHVPLLSLPLILGTEPDTVPAPIPYIEPDPELVEQWRSRLGVRSGVSVGLVWQGNPGHPNDRRRSMRLEALRPLLDCPGTRFISLQVGPGQDQIKGLEDHIIDPGAQIDPGSFADVAAIIAGLDLVISIDSAIAHLAGAMGKPAWILLASCNDWRWLKDREDTPWYPQARLFRQDTPGDWSDVVARLRVALWSFAGAGAPPSAETTTDPITASALRLTAPPRSTDPVVCDALFVEACRHHRARDLGRSKKLFEQILLLDPGHVNTLCNLGALELGMGHGPRALTLLETAVAQAPDLAPARMALADALLETKKTEQALAQYRKAVELAPNSAAVHTAYATALQRLGVKQAAMHLGEAERITHQHFRKALELDPNSDAVHAEYALALRELGDLDGAMKHFLAATKINQRQSSEFYEALGRTCAARGNAEGAEISLKHALMLDPRAVTAHCALGELYLARGRKADAEASFRRALALDPACSAALRGIKHAPTDGSATIAGS
jgi:tetratricopeptide (TPR) repeat protein